MNKINKNFIVIVIMLFVILILFNLINESNISINNQFTIYTGKILIIVYIRTWDIGLSICDNYGNFRMFSLAHGIFANGMSLILE